MEHRTTRIEAKGTLKSRTTPRYLSLACDTKRNFSSLSHGMPYQPMAFPLSVSISQNAFFDGVPLSLKTDNMKQVVSKSCRYEPVFTEALQQWATHYNVTLLATRVAKPKDKGAVENEVKIAYQRIYAPLRDEQFFDIGELNAAVLRQLKLHNKRLF